jgi:cytoskeletal protein CcmA (bactofilin family)
MDAMFSKTADPTGMPGTAAGTAPAPRPGGNASRSVLAADLKITGDITSSGTVEVMGEIDGNLAADILTIGQEGRVSGTVKARAVEVKGHVDGKIHSQDFTMRSSAQVAADVTYATVVIESGAQIEGRFALSKP